MEILAKVCEALQLWYVAKVAAIIFVTTVIAHVAMELIARSRSARKLFISFGRYLERIALPNEAALAILLTPFDSRVSHSVLATLYRRGEIMDSQVLITALIASPLSAMNTVARYTFPIALGSLGLAPALLYLSLSLVPAFARLGIGLLYDIHISGKTGSKSVGRANHVFDTQRLGLRDALRKGTRIALRICLRVAIALIVVNALMILGIFSMVTPYLEPVAHILGLGPRATTVFMISVIRPSLAIATLGTMLSNGGIELGEGFRALVIGHVLFYLLMDAPKAVIPFYTALYNTKIALKIVALIALSQLISLPIQLTIIGIALG